MDVDVLYLGSSDPADSALTNARPEEQDVVDEDEDKAFEPSQPACPAYAELLEVMARATERLGLSWKHEKPKPARGRLDEHFFGWP